MKIDLAISTFIHVSSVSAPPPLLAFLWPLPTSFACLIQWTLGAWHTMPWRLSIMAAAEAAAEIEAAAGTHQTLQALNSQLPWGKNVSQCAKVYRNSKILYKMPRSRDGGNSLNTHTHTQTHIHLASFSLLYTHTHTQRHWRRCFCVNFNT